MRAVVVGSGFGGLAAAIRLAAAGHDVTILEKRDQIGGRAYQYEIDGFLFDGGPTVITAPFMFEELFALAGERMEDHVSLVPLDPFYRAFDGRGGRFDFAADEEAFEAEILRRSPDDAAGFSVLRSRISRIFDVFYPYTERSMMQLPVMLRMLPYLLRHRAALGVSRLVESCVRDPFLRTALAFHPLLIGGDPARTPALYELIAEFERRWGVHYAIGGTGALVAALGALFERLGGTIVCGADVEQIVVVGRQVTGVRTRSGDHHPADVVISNADPGFTYDELLREDASAPVRPGWMSRMRLRSTHPSMSLHVLYFGADRTWPDSPLAHHNLLFTGNADRALKRVFRRRPRASADEVDDLFLYVHVPTRTDSSVAPEGCEALYVLVAAPPLAAGEAPDPERAARVRRRVLDTLDADYLPGLSHHLVAEHAIDPSHFRDVLNTPRGAAFSLRPTLFQSGWFRPHNRSRAVDGLYLVGAGTHPGAGVPAVLASGKIAAELIAQRCVTRRVRQAVRT